MMRGAFKKEVGQLLAGPLPPLLTALAGVISVPLNVEDSGDIGCKLEAFKCIHLVRVHQGNIQF
jgi:hypothetical protein